jgi:UDPglucose 6-dehydrogenase
MVTQQEEQLSMKASVVGLGKLGAPLLGVLASKGIEVWGIDLISEVVAKINNGIATVSEPKLQDLFSAHRDRIHATSDWDVVIGNSEVTYLLVPTPSTADGSFTNEYVLAAIEAVGQVLRTKPGYHLVVVNSTVMPGSTGGPLKDRLEAVSRRKVGRDIGLCYNPEFIALGNVVDGLLHPDFVLIGESDPQAGAMLESISRIVVGGSIPVARMSFVNAELTKIAVNAYVTMKISFANMLGEICEEFPEADADVVTAALGHDSRIGPRYLRGATGYGGPCFPRDTIAFTAMARQVGVDASLAVATRAINERQLERVTRIVARRTDGNARIAVLGLAYKPDTGVIEAAQGLMLAAALQKAGRRIIVHDPLALDAARSVLGSGVEFAASAAEAVGAADAVMVMVPCTEYKAFFAGWSGGGPTRLVVDCWRLVNADLTSARLQVIQLGRNGTFDAHDDDAIACAVA